MEYETLEEEEKKSSWGFFGQWWAKVQPWGSIWEWLCDHALLLQWGAYPCFFYDHKIQIQWLSKTLFMILTMKKAWTIYINYYVWTIRHRSAQIFQQTISQRRLIRTTCTFVSKIFGLTFFSPSYLTLFFIICLLAVLSGSQADRAEGATRYFGIRSQTRLEGTDRGGSTPLDSQSREHPSLPPLRFACTAKDQ